MARQATKKKSSAAGGAAARRTTKSPSAKPARTAKTAARKSSSSARARTAAARSPAQSRAAQQGKEKDLGDLFIETLKDLYHAEKQLVRALPKMAKAAESPTLRQAFEKHARETQVHADRLERIFEMSGKRPQTKPCHGMMGLVEEGTEVMKDFKGSDALDAGLVAAAQAVEHYEISRYGTLKSWAEQHGMREVASLLDQTLAEEKKTDEALTRIAQQNVNRRAA